jgi:hypothetical protein
MKSLKCFIIFKKEKEMDVSDYRIVDWRRPSSSDHFYLCSTHKFAALLSVCVSQGWWKKAVTSRTTQ